MHIKGRERMRRKMDQLVGDRVHGLSPNGPSKEIDLLECDKHADGEVAANSEPTSFPADRRNAIQAVVDPNEIGHGFYC